MNYEKLEFNIGDKVTYFPYEKPHKAVVKNVYIGDRLGHSPDDKRVFYTLTGRDGDTVVTETTGKCIKESVYFEKWTEEKRANFFK